MSGGQYDAEDGTYGVYSAEEAGTAVREIEAIEAKLVYKALAEYEHGAMSSGELVDETFMGEDSVYDGITALEREGLVQSRPSMANENIALYALNVEDDTR